MLGRLPGVQKTQIGHQGGSEIVEVQYNPEQINLQELTKTLKQQSSFYNYVAQNEEDYQHAQQVLSKSDIKKASRPLKFIESKHSLRTQNPDLYYLDLNEQQAIALNSWSYFGGSMPDILTEEQKQRRKQLKIKLQSWLPTSWTVRQLRPARSGIALENYRTKLIAWLENQ